MSKPIRLFEGTAQRGQPFWTLRNAAETGADPEIELNGVISELSWWGDEITPEMFKSDLNKLGNGGPVTLRINCYGGDVIAASRMRSILAEYPGRVTARIDGICASAATVVALGANFVKMQDSSYMMIHDPVVGILGYYDVEELAQMIDQLKSVKEGIVNVYEAKTGISRDRLGKLMKDETWMDAGEAVRMGFADAVIGGKQPISQETGNYLGNVAFANALRNFVNVPPALANRLTRQAEQIDRAAQRLRDEARLLA